jgi:hypothetical protein
MEVFSNFKEMLVCNKNSENCFKILPRNVALSDLHKLYLTEAAWRFPCQRIESFWAHIQKAKQGKQILPVPRGAKFRIKMTMLFFIC